MSTTKPDWLLAGIAAGATFLVSFVFVQLPLAVALPITALGFGAGTQLFRRKAAAPVLPGTVAPADIATALQDGRNKIATIRSLGTALGTRGTMAGKVAALCRTGDSILAEIKRDPGDLRRARQFLSYYLDTTITILEKYQTLAAQPVRDQSITSSLAKVEVMVDTIGRAFEKQLANLLTNDVMDLDADLALLQNTITMEGLGDTKEL